MPLTQLSITGQVSWKQELPIDHFQPRSQGRDSKSFSANGVSLDTFNEIFTAVFELPGGTGVEIDLQEFENLLGGTVAFTRVLSMLVQVSGEGCAVEITPGDTAPLDWFFRGSSDPRITLGDGESFLFNGNPAGDGYPVTPAARTLKFVNVSGGTVTSPATVTVVIPGGA